MCHKINFAIWDFNTKVLRVEHKYEIEHLAEFEVSEL
jgi:hypothetical protein